MPSRCYIALKRNHDDQKLAAAFLKKMTGEGTGKISVQSGAETVVMTKEAVVKRDEKDVKDAGSVKQLRGKYLGENSTLFLLFLETCGVV